MSRKYDENGKPVYCPGSGYPLTSMFDETTGRRVRRDVARIACPECGFRALVTKDKSIRKHFALARGESEVRA